MTSILPQIEKKSFPIEHHLVGIVSKTEAHDKGILHPSVHIIVGLNDKVKAEDKMRILVEKRGKNKDIFPGAWDLVGGHMGIEDFLIRRPIDKIPIHIDADSMDACLRLAAFRELQEETGIDFCKLDPEEYGYELKADQSFYCYDANSRYINQEFVQTFYMDLNEGTKMHSLFSDLKNLSVNEEVDGFELFTLDEMLNIQDREPHMIAPALAYFLHRKIREMAGDGPIKFLASGPCRGAVRIFQGPLNDKERFEIAQALVRIEEDDLLLKRALARMGRAVRTKLSEGGV